MLPREPKHVLKEFGPPQDLQASDGQVLVGCGSRVPFLSSQSLSGVRLLR